MSDPDLDTSCIPVDAHAPPTAFQNSDALDAPVLSDTDASLSDEIPVVRDMEQCVGSFDEVCIPGEDRHAGLE